MEKIKISTVKKNPPPLKKGLEQQVTRLEANTTLSEKQEATESLYQQLIDINNAVTPFRARAQVMKIIEEQIKRIIPVDAFFISVFSKDLKHNIFFLEGLGEEIRNDANVQEFVSKGYSFGSTSVYNTGEAVTIEYLKNLQFSEIDYDTLSEDFLDTFPIAKAKKKLGFKEGLIVPLKVEGNCIGAIILSSKQSNGFPKKLWSILEKIAEPIAIGVSNVLLYEEMQAAKAEIEALNQQLMDINNAVTPFRTREQVMKIVKEQLGKFVDFDSFYINTFNQEGKSYKLFLEGLEDEIRKDVLVQDFLQNTISYESTKVYDTGETLTSDYLKNLQFSEIDFDTLTEDFLDTYPIAKVEKKLGFKEGLIVPLRVEGNCMGAIMMGSRRANAFPKTLWNVLEKIAEPIAIGVSNVLLYEEMQSAKAEIEALNQQLMDINNAVTPFRTREQVMKIIGDQLRKVITFTDYFIVTYDERLVTQTFLISGLRDELKNDPNLQTFFNAQKSIDEVSVIHEDLKSWALKNPVAIMDIEHLDEAFTNPIARAAKLLGVKESLVVTLRIEDRIIGFLTLQSDARETFKNISFSLIEKLCEPIAIGVSNVLLYEEMQAAKAEIEALNQQLMDINNAVTPFRTREQVMKIVGEQLRKFFEFDSFYISYFEGDNLQLLLSLDGLLPQLKNYDLVKNLLKGERKNDYEIPTMEGEAKTSKYKDEFTFSFFKYQELPESLLEAWPLSRLEMEAGLQQGFVVALRVAGKWIGTLVLSSFNQKNYTENEFSLLRKLCEPIAIGVSNVLLYEEMQAAKAEIEQREKEKSFQVAITEVLTSTRNWDEAFLKMATVINQFIPCDYFDVAFVTQNFGYRKDQKGEWQPWYPINELLSFTGWTQQAYLEHITVLQPYTSVPGICQGADHEELKRNSEIAAYFTNQHGYRAAMRLPFSFKGQSEHAMLYLSSKNPQAFLSIHLDLLQKALPSLQLALENLFAFEDIEQREKEKAILLNLTNAIANITNKDELWDAMVTQLTPVFNFIYNQTFIHLLSADKKEFSFYLVNRDAMANKSFAFKEGLNKSFTIKGSLYEKVLNTPVWIFNVKDLQLSHPNFWGLKESKKIGIKQTAIIRLEHGGEVIGSLHLNADKEDSFKTAQIPLMEAVGKQVSIAIAGLRANEAIAQQLEEIKELQKQVLAENEYLSESIATEYNYGDIIGTSQRMQEVYKMVSQVSKTDSTVLILGETGTGKELIARAIHNASSRKDKLLVKVNCAALPPNLIESELFGHERGSFTGAFERRIGKFELANKGTLFLDEIGELPIELQAKLLRALQEKEIERIGGKTVIKTDVRIIAATNRRLEEEVKAQKFRNDLFFRINIFPIKLPPLHQRKEDIPLLANHFLQKFCNAMGRTITGIETSTLQALMAYHWPGNIRELENVIERAVIINKTRMLRINIGLYSQQNNEIESIAKSYQNMEHENVFQVKTYKESERELILKTLEIAKGRIRGAGGAAELLQVNPTTLESRMKKLGLIKKNKIDVVD
ncbi:MAG: sigma 54-interacting transcriptional regulator [Chitinophagaceae bacterium]|nr:sigma 54-interacting transcriptional regulator [Chitinophagaceae bacterium]